MIFFTTRPGTAGVEGLPRAGQNTPPLAGKLFDSTVTDTSARAGYEKRFDQSVLKLILQTAGNRLAFLTRAKLNHKIKLVFHMRDA